MVILIILKSIIATEARSPPTTPCHLGVIPAGITNLEARRRILGAGTIATYFVYPKKEEVHVLQLQKMLYNPRMMKLHSLLSLRSPKNFTETLPCYSNASPRLPFLG